jgi:hypothetical protein
VIEQIARNCRLLPQNLANCIGDFRPIRESAQWLRDSSRTTNYLAFVQLASIRLWLRVNEATS